METQIATLYAEAAPLDGKALIRHRTPKALGELAELAFLYRAASLGFGVAKPLGETIWAAVLIRVAIEDFRAVRRTGVPR